MDNLRDKVHEKVAQYDAARELLENAIDNDASRKEKDSLKLQVNIYILDLYCKTKQ